MFLLILGLGLGSVIGLRFRVRIRFGFGIGNLKHLIGGAAGTVDDSVRLTPVSLAVFGAK